jgi:hypothetical protein
MCYIWAMPSWEKANTKLNTFIGLQSFINPSLAEIFIHFKNFIW